VYPNNFRNLSYNAQGQLPPQSVEFVERLRKAKVDFADTLLWWVALGYDGPRLIAEALREAGTAPADITAYWSTKVKGWKGVYGTITWSADKRDGFQQEEIIMVQANSLKDGAFKLAPGYA
jgi:branched-chain amino acid transport system substrate-binding protein